MYSDYRAILFRRTNDELRELISKGKELYTKLWPGTRWRDKLSVFEFPSGATIWLTYLDRDEDVERYQGQSFAYIGFDELTHWPTAYPWNYMSSRLRTTNPNIKTYQRATTNPGGPGHAWVKKMFVDVAPPNTAFWATDSETGETLVEPEYLENGVLNINAGKPLFKRKFIPAKLADNPYLTNTDYRQTLMALPEDQRKALLEGSWDLLEGAAFKEFNRNIHTCTPFEIPNTWRKFRSADYGYSSYSGVLWFALAPNGQVFVYRELYVTGVLAEDLAYKVKEIERGDRVSYGVLDSSAWHKRGESRNSIAMKLSNHGVRWRPADRSKGSRVFGKQEIHKMLAVDEYIEEPKLIIFNTCTSLISQLPAIQLDKKNPEDVNTNGEDHLYDALRYGLMSRPKNKSVLEFDNDSGYDPSDHTPVDPIFGI